MWWLFFFTLLPLLSLRQAAQSVSLGLISLTFCARLYGAMWHVPQKHTVVLVGKIFFWFLFFYWVADEAADFNRAHKAASGISKKKPPHKPNSSRQLFKQRIVCSLFTVEPNDEAAAASPQTSPALLLNAAAAFSVLTLMESGAFVRSAKTVHWQSMKTLEESVRRRVDVFGIQRASRLWAQNRKTSP